MLAEQLGMPECKRRWLQRHILPTPMTQRLGIVRADTLQGAERLPVPPKHGKSAWLIRRDLLEQHHDELLAFLFPPDERSVG